MQAPAEQVPECGVEHMSVWDKLLRWRKGGHEAGTTRRWQGTLHNGLPGPYETFCAEMHALEKVFGDGDINDHRRKGGRRPSGNPRASSTSEDSVSPGRWRCGDGIDNRYEVFQVFAGGFGVVYICYDHGRNAPVAIKGLREDYVLDEALVRLFIREAEEWIRLGSHQNIVEALRVERIEARPYIMLEHVSSSHFNKLIWENPFLLESLEEGLLDMYLRNHSGDDGAAFKEIRDEILGPLRVATPHDSQPDDPSLAYWLRSEVAGSQDLRTLLFIGAQIANGMAYAWEQRSLVHRDLNPRNVLITERGASGRTVQPVAKISDFGLSKAAAEAAGAQTGSTAGEASTSLLAGKVVGTPPYMAPEQWMAIDDCDTRSDVYSFGCLLYEMLTGAPPFGFGDSSLKQAHLSSEPRSLCSLGAPFPAELDRLILTCLAKDAGDRFPSFREVLDELGGVYDHLFHQQLVLEPSEGHAPSQGEYFDRARSLHALGRHEEAVDYLEGVWNDRES